MGGGWRIGRQNRNSLYSARTRARTIGWNTVLAPPSATRHPLPDRFDDEREQVA